MWLKARMENENILYCLLRKRKHFYGAHQDTKQSVEGNVGVVHRSTYLSHLHTFTLYLKRPGPDTRCIQTFTTVIHRHHVMLLCSELQHQSCVLLPRSECLQWGPVQWQPGLEQDRWDGLWPPAVLCSLLLYLSSVNFSAPHEKLKWIKKTFLGHLGSF